MVNSLTPFDARKSILFLGSGFTSGASNTFLSDPDSSSIFTTSDIKDALEAIAGNMNEGYDFRETSQVAIQKHPDKVAELLDQRFSRCKPIAHHLQILDHPWWRIYTTNYDDLIENSFFELRLTPNVYTLEDEVPNKIANKSIIHLHGYIKRVEISNLDNSLVLHENSYVRQILTSSPWLLQFRSDVRFADSVIFVGFSNRDHHINAMMLSSTDTFRKTSFITQSGISDFDKDRLSPYGQILPIGVESAPSAIASALQMHKALPTGQLNRHFSQRTGVPDRRSVRVPSTADVFELIVKGKYVSRFSSDYIPSNRYELPNKINALKILEAIEQNECVIFHSRIGNGKTIISEKIISSLINRGYSVFIMRHNSQYEGYIEEVDTISKNTRPIVLIDNIFFSLSNLQLLIENNIKILGVCRTGELDIKYTQFSQYLRSIKPRIVDINFVPNEEFTEYSEKLDKIGIVMPFKRTSSGKIYNEVRSFILDCFEDTKIHAKLREEYNFSKLADDERLLVTCLLIFSYNGAPLAPEEIASVTSIDPYLFLKSTNSAIGDYVEANNDRVQIRSSVLAQHVLSKIINHETMFNDLEAIILRLSSNDERLFRQLMPRILNFSDLWKISNRQKHLLNRIIAFYDRIKNINSVSDHPLYWLQYSIALMEKPDPILADQIMTKAYETARRLEAPFRTYQLDTQRLRLRTILFQNAPSSSVLSDLTLSIDEVTALLSENNHRSHALVALDGISTLSTDTIGRMHPEVVDLFHIKIESCIRFLDSFSADVKAYLGSEVVALRLRSFVSDRQSPLSPKSG